MLLFEIRTNLRLSQIPANFPEKTVDVLTSIHNTTADRILVSVAHSQVLYFGGSGEPCALGKLSVTDADPTTAEDSHWAKLFEHLESELEIPPNRVVLAWNELSPGSMAWNGKPIDV